jgi:hypothetical protein
MQLHAGIGVRRKNSYSVSQLDELRFRNPVSLRNRVSEAQFIQLRNAIAVFSPNTNTGMQLHASCGASDTSEPALTGIPTGSQPSGKLQCYIIGHSTSQQQHD